MKDLGACQYLATIQAQATIFFLFIFKYLEFRLQIPKEF